MNFDILIEKFKDLEIINNDNSFEKIRITSPNLIEIITSIINIPEYGFDMLSTIIAVDLGDDFELIYDLYSVKSNKFMRISVLLDRKSPIISTLTGLFKSAYFDECEIFDMFGIEFKDNPDLKRLFMPKGWIGHPLRKDYVQEDERLVWNK